MRRGTARLFTALAAGSGGSKPCSPAKEPFSVTEGKALNTRPGQSRKMLFLRGPMVRIHVPPPASLVRTRFRSSFPLVHAGVLGVVWRAKYGSDFRGVVGRQFAPFDQSMVNFQPPAS